MTDIDVVVRPQDFARAHELLTGNDWRPAGSGVTAHLEFRPPEAMSLQLVRGQLGSLRLHRTLHRARLASPVDDASIWARSSAGAMAHAAVRLPSATDALAITLAQSSRGSYWMVDIAAAVDRGVDWALLESLIARRRLHAPGIAGLRYVRERLERAVPDSVLRRLERAAISGPVTLASWLARAQPDAGRSGAFGLARTVVGQARRLGARWRSTLSSPDRRAARVESGAKAE